MTIIIPDDFRALGSGVDHRPHHRSATASLHATCTPDADRPARSTSRPRSARQVIEVAGKAGIEGKKGWQDTSRTPFRRKAQAFSWLHAEASVDERAARKRKASDNNDDRGTPALAGRNAVLP